MSTTKGTDLCDDEELCGDGARGDGIGEWPLSENAVLDDSATGDEVFQPKKVVSLVLGDLRGLWVDVES